MNGRPIFSGRVAPVTGASGGIGGAIALRLAAAGADLALTYATHRDEASGSPAAPSTWAGGHCSTRATLPIPGCPPT
jgi:NAD(P)-dependent dehydrogenase (short-subunit alcohol dehydrogenase family)